LFSNYIADDGDLGTTKDNNLGIKSDPLNPGANGQQTGLNNSAVCGNRQAARTQRCANDPTFREATNDGGFSSEF
jgi:hypothetical protein